MICGLDLFPIVRLSLRRLWPVPPTVQTSRNRFPKFVLIREGMTVHSAMKNRNAFQLNLHHDILSMNKIAFSWKFKVDVSKMKCEFLQRLS